MSSRPQVICLTQEELRAQRDSLKAARDAELKEFNSEKEMLQRKVQADSSRL